MKLDLTALFLYSKDYLPSVVSESFFVIIPKIESNMIAT